MVGGAGDDDERTHTKRVVERAIGVIGPNCTSRAVGVEQRELAGELGVGVDRALGDEGAGDRRVPRRGSSVSRREPLRIVVVGDRQGGELVAWPSGLPARSRG